MARPKYENRDEVKTAQLQIRVTVLEKQFIKAVAKRKGLSMSKFLISVVENAVSEHEKEELEKEELEKVNKKVS